MWMYVIVFFAALLVDLVPVFGPPAWMAMVFLQVKFHLDIWKVLIAGVLGSTLGRYLMSLYIPKVSDKLLKKRKNEEMEFVGEKLGQKGWRCMLFVLLFTLAPIPSTPLFTAAGLSRLKAALHHSSFLCGKVHKRCVHGVQR